jgi:hypothetical protein
VAGLAGAHHERLDGSGYHRGARAAELWRSQRLLAAADVFASLTEERPYRAARKLSEAVVELEAEVAAGAASTPSPPRLWLRPRAFPRVVQRGRATSAHARSRFSVSSRGGSPTERSQRR